VDLAVDRATLDARRSAWKEPPARYTGGVMGKYAGLVGSAALGAVTTPPGEGSRS
jgi:dihydroxy-acid dehydratase